MSVGEPFYASRLHQRDLCLSQCHHSESVWSAPVANLFQFIPMPNLAPSANFPTGAYSSADNTAPLQDDKAGFRLDANTRFGLLSGYYFVDKYSLVNPLAGGSFGNFGGSQPPDLLSCITFSDTKSFGASSVNEFRLELHAQHLVCQYSHGPGCKPGIAGFYHRLQYTGNMPPECKLQDLTPHQLEQLLRSAVRPAQRSLGKYLPGARQLLLDRWERTT